MPVLIKEIAAAAGVSTATVSRVLNSSGYVSEATGKKVRKAMTELGYSPNLLARSLVTKRTNTIGLMIPHIASPFFSALSSAVEARADELGFNVILCHTREDSERERKSLAVLINRQVDGIIVTPVGKRWDYFAAAAAKTPLVFAARKSDDLPVSSVTVDNLAGSYRVMKHLLNLGHRRVGVVNGPLDVSSGRDRWLGARRVLEEHGLPTAGPHIAEGDFTAEAGYRLTAGILTATPRPTALFAANHLTAVGMLRAVREAGLRIPEDISVAAFEGFDDSVLDFLVHPRLTANIHPTHAMGVTAVDLLLEQVRSSKAAEEHVARDVTLNTKLVVTPSAREYKEP